MSDIYRIQLLVPFDQQPRHRDAICLGRRVARRVARRMARRMARQCDGDPTEPGTNCRADVPDLRYPA